MTREKNIVISSAVCPQCKSNNLLLLEVWEGHTIQWDQVNGSFDRNDGVLEPGDPHHMEATCKECKHSWRMRKKLQIDDVIYFTAPSVVNTNTKQ